MEIQLKHKYKDLILYSTEIHGMYSDTMNVK